MCVGSCRHGPFAVCTSQLCERFALCLCHSRRRVLKCVICGCVCLGDMGLEELKKKKKSELESEKADALVRNTVWWPASTICLQLLVFVWDIQHVCVCAGWVSGACVRGRKRRCIYIYIIFLFLIKYFFRCKSEHTHTHILWVRQKHTWPECQMTTERGLIHSANVPETCLENNLCSTVLSSNVYDRALDPH